MKQTQCALLEGQGPPAGQQSQGLSHSSRWLGWTGALFQLWLDLVRGDLRDLGGGVRTFSSPEPVIWAPMSPCRSLYASWPSPPAFGGMPAFWWLRGCLWCPVLPEVISVFRSSLSSLPPVPGPWRSDADTPWSPGRLGSISLRSSHLPPALTLF